MEVGVNERCRRNGMKPRKRRMTRKQAEAAIEAALDHWYEWPDNFEDVCELMEYHLRWAAGQQSMVVVSPAYGHWEDDPVKWIESRDAGIYEPETLWPLIGMNHYKLLTTDSQDQLRYEDEHGVLEQRAYLSGFIRPDRVEAFVRNLPSGIHAAWAPSDGKRVPKSAGHRVVVTRSRAPNSSRWRKETAQSTKAPVGEAYIFRDAINSDAFNDLLHNTVEVHLYDEDWDRDILFDAVLDALPV